jgi:hypothetical protein
MRNIIFSIPFLIVLFACNSVETDPKVVLGKEWNQTAEIVADTTSQFRASDRIVIQMDNGKPFPSQEVELRVYQHESNRLLFKHASPVKSNQSKLSLNIVHPIEASKILRTSTPGPYRIAFAIGDSIIAEKKLELVK